MVNESQTSLQFSLLKSFLTINDNQKDFSSSSTKQFLAVVSLSSEELEVSEDTGLKTLSDDEEIKHLMYSNQLVEVSFGDR